jgi:urea transport system permease protein
MKPRAIAAALLLVLALVGTGPRAHAETLESALQRFASTKFDDIERGIADIATSGDAAAAGILQALGEGRLVFRPSDRAVFIKDDSGLTLAATGEAAADVVERGLKPVRVNNRIRRALDAALGQLTLLSPDPAARRAAADSVFVRPDAAGRALLEDALARETDRGVRAALERARAALLLEQGANMAEREEGVLALARFPSPDVRSKLLAALNGLHGSDPADAELRAALAQSLATVDSRLWLLGLVQSVFQGLSLGSVLLLAAIGLAITFGVMGVINMAHGEMVMLGAYTTYAVQQLFLAHAPAALGVSVLVAVPAAFLVAGAIGVAIERGIIRFLYGRPLETLLATWGLSLILQQTVRSLFGPSNREVVTPSWMSGVFEVTGGLAFTWNRMVIILFAMAVFAALVLVIRHTAWGLEMRAVTQNRRMAGSMGIRTPWVDALTFGLGSGIAGIAGVALAQIDNVSPNLGQGYIIDSFMVVVFGGVGNLWGTLTGALTLGIVNKFLEPVTGAVLGKIFVLVALILFIQKRPRGLFQLRGRAVEG